MPTKQKPVLIPELYCSDMQASLSFYTAVLGFDILYARPEEKFAMLERQGAKIMLEELKQNNDRIWLTGLLEQPFGRGINLQIETPQIQDLYRCVQDSDASIFLEMEEKWYRRDNHELGNKQFIVCDPDGYLLRFFENLGSRVIPS